MATECWQAAAGTERPIGNWGCCIAVCSSHLFYKQAVTFCSALTSMKLVFGSSAETAWWENDELVSNLFC
jgi:hypothetical protein